MNNQIIYCSNYLDFCGRTNAPPPLNGKQVLWLRNSGQSDPGMSGPVRDHTSDSPNGWYIYVPIDAQDEGTALLQSETLRPYNTPMCLGFYYHIHTQSQSIGSDLKLLVAYSSPFASRILYLANLTSSSLNKWEQFALTISNLPAGRFMLITPMGSIAKAVVAVDDITLKPGPCGQTLTTVSMTPKTPTTPEPQSESQWDCNFETERCNWVLDGNPPGWDKSSWLMSKLT